MEFLSKEFQAWGPRGCSLSLHVSSQDRTREGPGISGEPRLGIATVSYSHKKETHSTASSYWGLLRPNWPFSPGTSETGVTWFELGFQSAHCGRGGGDQRRLEEGRRQVTRRPPPGPCFFPTDERVSPPLPGGLHRVTQSSWQGQHKLSLCPPLPYREKRRELSAGTEAGSVPTGPGEGRSLPSPLWTPAVA